MPSSFRLIFFSIGWTIWIGRLERILRWKLSGRGNVDNFGDGSRFYFRADGEEKGFREEIKKDNEKYQELNKQLASRGLVYID